HGDVAQRRIEIARMHTPPPGQIDEDLVLAVQPRLRMRIRQEVGVQQWSSADERSVSRSLVAARWSLVAARCSLLAGRCSLVAVVRRESGSLFDRRLPLRTTVDG